MKSFKNIMFIILAILLVIIIPISHHVINIYYEDKKISAQQNYDEIITAINSLNKQLTFIKEEQEKLNYRIHHRIQSINDQLNIFNKLLNNMMFNSSIDNVKYKEYNSNGEDSKK